MNNKDESQLSDQQPQPTTGVPPKPFPFNREVELYTEGGAVRLRFKKN